MPGRRWSRCCGGQRASRRAPGPVTISPGNEPSLRLAVQYGSVEVGEQWDEDGLEIIHEIDAAEPRRPDTVA